MLSNSEQGKTQYTSSILCCVLVCTLIFAPSFVFGARRLDNNQIGELEPTVFDGLPLEFL